MKPTRPVLRYFGGKWKLAPWLLSIFPPHRIYVEPFGGGASVLMRKPRVYAEVYNDLNTEVVNVFRVLRDPDHAEKLCHLLTLTPFSREDFKEAYIQTDDPIEAARRTIERSFMGFGTSALETPRGMRTRASIWGHTGFRRNSNRSGTTPAHDWAKYPSQVIAFCERLQGVVIENKLAVDVIHDHDRVDTLHYVDPPYVMDSRGDRRHEYRHEMTDDDHRGLAQALRNAKGMVILSGYPSELYRELYGDWETIERDHYADGARPRVECVWLNQAASNRRLQMRISDGNPQKSIEPSTASKSNTNLNL